MLASGGGGRHVEGMLASGGGRHAAAGCGPYASHCGLANTASGLIGLPHFCFGGVLDLPAAVTAPTAVARLPEVVVSRVSLTMLATSDLSLSPAILSSSLAFVCSLIFFSTAAATALSNLAFLALASLLPSSAPPLLHHSRSSVLCSFVSLEYSLLS